jgi:hypothetical protein
MMGKNRSFSSITHVSKNLVSKSQYNVVEIYIKISITNN